MGLHRILRNSVQEGDEFQHRLVMVKHDYLENEWLLIFGQTTVTRSKYSLKGLNLGKDYPSKNCELPARKRFLRLLETRRVKFENP